ncbi:MAG: lysophospholipid acyltransferase family protein [Lyngbya sp.]|nr:lysophospholipid acyltransferase family protein [Lyngbya sp.]
MSSDQTVQSSRWLLTALGTRMFLHNEDRIPTTSAVLVVSNHRSFLDPVVLTAALGRPIRFACHHYMGQVPVLRDVVTTLGAFPLQEPTHRSQHFFHQASQLLQNQEMVGVFPEGAGPMVTVTSPDQIGSFHRGFAHLAWRVPVDELAILPVAIAAFEEQLIRSGIPLQLLSWFDPSEPLFNRPGWHPMVLYKRTNILVGRPYWIKPQQQQQYRGKGAKELVANLTAYCEDEIANLLNQGCI